ncbi:MAG: hypothetical protein AAGJ92_01835 [Pseudomonadota bacterium]
MHTLTELPAEIELIRNPELREYLRQQIETSMDPSEAEDTRRLIWELIKKRY